MIENDTNQTTILPANLVQPSLPEVHRTIPVPMASSRWFKMRAWAGPGLMIAVGYMDPGNWATDIAGGSRFGYTLLSVVLISNLFAMLLQHLALKLGIATGRDLAQACRAYYSRPVAVVLWVLCEIAIAACDLAEVLGSALALQLLFGIPLEVGVLITAADVLLILFLQNRGFRYLEVLVGTLVLTVFGAFTYEILSSSPVWGEVAVGLVPHSEVVTNPAMLYVAIGILGATVMPHNLYLHSGIVLTRAFERTDAGKRSAVRYATLDSTLSLGLAFFVNAAILVVAAAVFHARGMQEVGRIEEAFRLLSPLLGVKAASVVFALALLASGQNSTLTGTLAGQIVMEGFVSLRLSPWLRRLVTRLLAIVPALVVIHIWGAGATNELLLFSQVVLSMQLPFAVFPLVMFTASRAKMGALVNPLWLTGVAWMVALLIAALNVYLIVDTVGGI